MTITEAGATESRAPLSIRSTMFEGIPDITGLSTSEVEDQNNVEM